MIPAREPAGKVISLICNLLLWERGSLRLIVTKVSQAIAAVLKLDPVQKQANFLLTITHNHTNVIMVYV